MNFFSDNVLEENITINNMFFYKKKNIIYFKHLERNFELLFRGDSYNYIVFAKYTIKAFQSILPYLIKLNIKFYYVNAEDISNYPNDILNINNDVEVYQRYSRCNRYLNSLYDAIYMYRESDYNTTNITNSPFWEHYVKYNNKNKKIKKFESLFFEWREPIYRYILDTDNRSLLEKFYKKYFRSEISDYEMSKYDLWVRGNAIKELLAYLGE